MGEWEWLVQQCERGGRELPEFSVWLWEQDIFRRGSGRARRLAIARTASAIGMAANGLEDDTEWKRYAIPRATP